MRTKRVNRYYCDFCKKANCSKSAMAKHELHCTMNPERECRMCKALNQPQPEMVELLALLPDPKGFEKEDDLLGALCVSYPGLSGAVEEAMKILRERVGDCPVCIMAALRQRGIHLSMVESFDFKKEVENTFRELNAEHYCEEHDTIW
jgi:hypothetical protein